MAMIKARLASRRGFLHELGFGIGGISLVGAGFLSIPRTAGAQACAPPGPTGTPKPWRRDCRPIRPRRPASTLTTAEVQKVRDAYKAMRDLAASDPSDPRGFAHQANIHCWNCGGVGSTIQVHGSWQFFAWHRAYLYFHERILGRLIGDMEFRLPYWDWDNASHRTLPPAYATPSDATNPLWNGTRSMNATDELPDEDVGHDVMEAALTASGFADFGGSATGSGIPEGAPHGSVHVDVNGDMGSFGTAAKDPVFYAHHSNVDKIWSDWNKASATHDNPTDPTFLNLTFTFYDENKVWRSITATRLLDHESRLRYVYGPSKFIESLPCLLDWVVIRPLRPFQRALDLDPRTREALTKALSGKAHIRIHFEGLRVPVERSAVYRVYADPAEADTNRGPESPGYLGTVPVVLNDKDNRHPTNPERRAVFDVTKRLSALLDRQRPLEFALVERRAKGEKGQVMPVRARAVYFSVAAVE
jgi:polyphenol oxidase